MSHITCHIIHVICHMSCVTCNILYILIVWHSVEPSLQVHSSIVKISSRHLHSQTIMARDLKFWDYVHHPGCVMCHMSGVRCQVCLLKIWQNGFLRAISWGLLFRSPKELNAFQLFQVLTKYAQIFNLTLFKRYQKLKTKKVKKTKKVFRLNSCKLLQYSGRWNSYCSCNIFSKI